VGTGGAEGMIGSDEVKDASPKVEGVAGWGVERSKPRVLAKVLSEEGSVVRTFERSLSEGNGEAVDDVVIGEKMAWRSSLENQERIAPSESESESAVLRNKRV